MNQAQLDGVDGDPHLTSIWHNGAAKPPDLNHMTDYRSEPQSWYNPGFIQSPTSPNALETSFSESMDMTGAQHTANSSFPSFNPPPGTVWIPVPRHLASMHHTGRDGFVGFQWPQQASAGTGVQHSGPHALSSHSPYPRRLRQDDSANVRASLTSQGVHDYEELPGNRNREGMGLDQNSTPPVPPLSSLPGLFESSDWAMNKPPSDDLSVLMDTASRKRRNPLYGAQTATPVNALQDPPPPKKRSCLFRWRIRIWCLAFTIVAMMASISLIIALMTSMKIINLETGSALGLPEYTYSPFVASNYTVPSNNELHVQIQNLEDGLTLLQEKYDAQQVLIAAAQQEISAITRRLNCTYTQNTNAVTATILIQTEWVPRSSEQSVVVLFATCSTKNIPFHQLEEQTSSNGSKRYRCTCVASSPSNQESSCTVNYWRCPGIS